MKNINWGLIAMYTLSASIMFYLTVMLVDCVYSWLWRI